MKTIKDEAKESDKVEEQPAERPQVELHDPFRRFDFEPTDGGAF